MSFLQPLLLIALPLMALPIIIHLINQRRYQTMPWGAMMFLLAANRMSRGYARIRQWLILLLRTLAIAALIFAISRPLASGWLGAVSGGAADAAIVLIDRSPSMQQRGEGTSVSKLETGVAQLSSALDTIGTSRIVLIDSATPDPRELGTSESLLDAPEAGPVDATADLPTMLLAALDYVQANKLGQTDIWICSDLRESDWKSTDGRWQSIRDAFAAFDNRIRFHLLAYTQSAPDNAAVRVTNVRRDVTTDGADVLVSLQVTRESGNDTVQSVPIEFEVDGARSTLNLEMSGAVYELKEHRIPVAADHERGWGRVSIPADANPADNSDFFVFDVTPPRRTLVVSEDPLVARPLEIAAGIAPAPGVEAESQLVPSANLNTVAWEDLALVLWHGPLPEGDNLANIEAFVARGGSVVFFPTEETSNAKAFNVGWGEWQTLPNEISVDSWRGDTDLLANTLSGASLPVGTIKVRAYAQLDGPITSLATLLGGAPLLARADTPVGKVYFCTTTPRQSDSTLAVNGVVLYVAIQRALSVGSSSLGNTKQLAAGSIAADDAILWSALAGRDEILSNEQAFRAGVYEHQGRLLALNRPAVEDQPNITNDETLSKLFENLSLDRVDDAAGNLSTLIQEIWRIFLVSMMVALLLEAVLCLPKVTALGGIRG